MFGSALSLGDLRACLAMTPPLELKGMGLLREQPQFLAGSAHIPRHQLVEAVTEIIAYTGRCVTVTRSLANLAPVPLLTMSVLEFGL
jgi:hypothetical protein